MKKTLFCVWILSAGCFHPGTGLSAGLPGISVVKNYGRLPLSFEENKGQASPDIDFVSRGAGYLVELTPDGVNIRAGSAHPSLKFHGAAHQGRGEQVLHSESNYLIGADPANWRMHVQSFQRVTYRELYPNIDLIYYGKNGRLEFDLVARPGADLGKISIEVEGVEKPRLDANGDLILSDATTDIRFQRPLVYQDFAGVRKDIRCRWAFRSAKSIGFDLGSYDSHRPLTIDPVLVYSTFFGGSRDDHPYAVAVDSSGCAYLVGDTWSLDFPRKNALQASGHGDRDVFVAKMAADGGSLIYSTYLGGTGFDSGRAIAIDASGSSYITGVTWSRDFPTTSGALKPTPIGQGDVFVAKLNASGTGLIYSTYMGGSGADTATAIAVDTTGNSYIAGYTSSTDFPVFRAIQTAFRGGFNDGFVFALNASGSALVYSTYLGGAGNDVPQGIAVSAAGEAFVAGSTDSTDFPTVNAISSRKPGGLDGFLVKINALGSGLAYATYIGGASTDMANAVALDASGAAYVTGATMSQDFPTTSGSLTRAPDTSYDVFVVKVTPEPHLAYAVRFGGASSEQGNAIAVDLTGNAYVGGYTYSTDFPVVSAVQGALKGSSDAFVTGINSSGTDFVFSTFLGGAADDQATGLAIDAAGNLYAAGYTLSEGFPTTPGVLQPALHGGMDGFLAKLSDIIPSQPVAAINAGGPAVATSIRTWTADSYYTGGGGYSFATYISDTTEQAVYQTNRWGNFQYNLPVADGAYDLTLKFAEIAPVVPGQRLFSVAANGLTLLQHFDVVASAGGLYRALDYTFPVNVAGGTLQVKFIPELANAMVSGILVRRRSTMAPVQVNAGGPGLFDPQTGSWLPDTGYTGGGAYSTMAPIFGTSTPQIYQTNRWGASSYVFTVPNGSRTVTLKFAEIAPVVPGQRLFDVVINGTRVLQDFDVVVAAGGQNIAVDRSFTVSVTAQQVKIDFVPKQANPFVSAISIR